MLYNKALDKPQQKSRTWAHLIAWLETKDPDEEYAYCNQFSCLAAQYNASIGRDYNDGAVFSNAPSENPSTYFSFDRRLERLASKTPHNFGAALERARG